MLDFASELGYMHTHSAWRWPSSLALILTKMAKLRHYPPHSKPRTMAGLPASQSPRTSPAPDVLRPGPGKDPCAAGDDRRGAAIAGLREGSKTAAAVPWASNPSSC